MQIKCASPRLQHLINKPKRVKILVGGRGSTKSTFVADYVLACMSIGQLWCCSREFQNSIDESVHRLLIDEIERLNFSGFGFDKTHIFHQSGGRNFYKGLARNPYSLKSTLSGIDGLWIEEGETLSENTLRILTASVRLSALDSERLLKGEQVKMPEIWVTMNRGSIADPISKKWLARAEPDLLRHGVYEDDNTLVVEINYTDIPKSWFEASGLESERLDDFQNMPRSFYDHKWHGKYLEVVENSIIQPEWFDACVDAHEKLGFQPLGVQTFSYDPADTGDAKAWAHRHGSVITDAQQTTEGEIDSATDWALSEANSLKPDRFVWDCDGMGIGLKRQVSDAFSGKKVELIQFKGGGGCDDPDRKYDPVEGDESQAKTNNELFVNLRAQCYWVLRDRMLRTWQAIDKNKRTNNPDDLISFSSKIKDIDQLKSELCRIPRKFIGSGRIQLLTKAEMKKLEIPSPNMADAVMMTEKRVQKRKRERINYPGKVSIA